MTFYGFLGCGRKAPVQRGEGSVPWEVSAEAWKEYAALGHDQSHERLCARGGFSVEEIAVLLYQRIKRLEGSPPSPRERGGGK